MSTYVKAGIISAVFLVLVVAGAVYQYRQVLEEKATAPSWEQHVEEIKDLKARIAALTPRIAKATGAGYCGSDVDCHMVGLGAKLCGKFDKYLIYSSADADEVSLVGMIAEYNGYAERLNKISYKVLNCGVPSMPLKCIESRCHTVGGGK
jgi:hypothetical protein